VLEVREAARTIFVVPSLSAVMVNRCEKENNHASEERPAH